MNSRRIVITGCGVVTPIGIGKEEFWNALENGISGVSEISSFDASNHNIKIAAEIKNFQPENWLDKKEIRRTDRVIQFAVAAADLAIKDSGIDLEKIDKNMFGVYIGSGEGGIHTTEEGIRILTEKGPSRVGPFTVPMMITNMPAAYIAIRTGAKGPNISVVTACATALNSMGEAYHCILRGDADVMLTGGTESAITPFSVASFASLKALSAKRENPQSASRPFDKERDGFVIGEGAGVLLFEEYEHAKARGAHVYAEVKGFGISCDAYHITAPEADGDGAFRAMEMAVKRANWDTNAVDLINAHGTSTQLNDKIETIAIKRLFGEEKSKQIMVQATKSMIGHTLGASGAIGTIAALLAFDKGIVHPTINLTTPDPECDLNIPVNKAVKVNVNKALINSFGFGGHNAVIALEKCK